MKRDMELVRVLLRHIRDDNPYRLGDDYRVGIPELYTDSQITEHLRLMAEKGLFAGIEIHTMQSYGWAEPRLTWEGHDFIELASSDAVWLKAVKQIRDKGIGLTIEVLKPVLVEVATRLVMGQ